MILRIPDRLIYVKHELTGFELTRETLIRDYHAEEIDSLEAYDEYKIAAVRNPYDLVVAASKERDLSIREYLEDSPRDLFPFDNQVDYLMFYEVLEESLNEILSDICLPSIHIGLRKIYDYQEYYTPYTKSMVDQLYGRDIRKYGYRY